jgi:septal ring factor EnvC (AmiA/AmiB activator)
MTKARLDIYIFIFISLFVFMPLAADEIADKQDQLDDIKEELKSKRAAYDSLGQAEKDQAIKLRHLEQETALSSQLLLKMKRENTRLKGNISSQQIDLQITEHQRMARAEILRKRLCYIYKTGNSPAWLEILSSGDPTSALGAYKNMEALISYDKHLLESYKELSNKIETGLVRYKANVSSLQALESDQASELSRREKTLTARKKLVDKLKKDRNKVEKSISELEDDEREISGIIEDLQQQQSQMPLDTSLIGLAKARGDLIWPVRGKIIRQFGNSRDKRGIELTNPGIDIQAKIGANVAAAAPGTIIYINWLRGYGQFIIIDHGLGYYTLYANLSDILVDIGDRVNAGELIALVGDSGSLEGPKLHFEIRYRKEQLNPMDWLR